MLLSITPIISAIAAGNVVILKPSEISVFTSSFIAKFFKELNIPEIKVVEGGIPETTALLKQRFDLIFYTGNGSVARIIMKAASEFLTPVVLELGGKSPVIIDKDVDIKVVAKRIMWAKTMNCGQVLFTHSSF